MDEWIVRTDAARSGGFHEFDGVSGCSYAEPPQPPRQASPATPP